MASEQLRIYLKGNCLGRKKAVKSPELEQTMGVSGNELRRQVNRLRRQKVPICSGPEGYFYARNAGEIYATIHSATSFAPEAALTRGMIVTILWRMEAEPKVLFDGAYTDVADAQWYADAVKWVATNGIVNGYGNGAFGPNDPATREQLAVILYRYAKYKGQDVSAGERRCLLGYADAHTVSEYAIPAMQWACNEGLINGAGGKLMPTDNTTRAQIAAIIHRYLEG